MAGEQTILPALPRPTPMLTDRRTFLKASAALTATAALGRTAQSEPIQPRPSNAELDRILDAPGAAD